MGTSGDLLGSTSVLHDRAVDAVMGLRPPADDRGAGGGPNHRRAIYAAAVRCVCEV